MVKALKSLHFPGGNKPSQTEQAHVAQALADILEQAQTIGHDYAVGEKIQRGITWGGKSNPLASAWNIVSTFIDRIVSWFAGQDDPEDVSDQDIQDMVDTVAERVGDTEVAVAIEQAVMDELEVLGVSEVRWVTQSGACKLCLGNEEAGSIPLGSDFPSGDAKPPAHSNCRCSLDWNR